MKSLFVFFCSCSGSRTIIVPKPNVTDKIKLDEEERHWIFNDGPYAFSNWGTWGIYEIRSDAIFIKQQLIGAGKRFFENNGKIRGC